jgi:hypothetical protein
MQTPSRLHGLEMGAMSRYPHGRGVYLGLLNGAGHYVNFLIVDDVSYSNTFVGELPSPTEQNNSVSCTFLSPIGRLTLTAAEWEATFPQWLSRAQNPVERQFELSSFSSRIAVPMKQPAPSFLKFRLKHSDKWNLYPGST